MEEVKLTFLFPVGELNLERAVCNHGFFMMAPNHWDPSKKSLVRPFRLLDKKISVTASINQSPNDDYLVITKMPYEQNVISYEDFELIRKQVSRMVRDSAIDQTRVDEFHKIHPEAKKIGFGRIFRSPTLFEDIVKSVLLCNCTWKRSLDMAQALCDLQQKMSKGAIKIKWYSQKRKRSYKPDAVQSKKIGGNFPIPEELACLDVKTLNKHCNLGYRAAIILKLAQDVINRVIDLGDFEQYGSEVSFNQLRRNLMNIKGFGTFIMANVRMCVGFYDEIPADTETIKHLEEVHGKTDLDKKNITAAVAQVYDKYAPYQCLAYWLEHVEYYEKSLGKLSELPHSRYCNVASLNMEVIIAD